MSETEKIKQKAKERFGIYTKTKYGISRGHSNQSIKKSDWVTLGWHMHEHVEGFIDDVLKILEDKVVVEKQKILNFEEEVKKLHLKVCPFAEDDSCTAELCVIKAILEKFSEVGLDTKKEKEE